jgi:uncharacterized glyoxalase superfamily protein PhnB
MAAKIVPMIHVPDVRATVQWYTQLGFTVQSTHEEKGELDWASMAYGGTEIMFNAGGKLSAAKRREVDLYLRVEDIVAHYEQLRHSVEIVEGPHDTFYGTREFMFRDINGFWLIFGEPVPAGG